MNLLLRTVMLSMARAAWTFGLPGSSLTAGLMDAGPSNSARRRPSRVGYVIFTQVKRRPKSTKECPSEHHTRESLRQISGWLPSSPLSSNSTSGLTSTAARFRSPSTAIRCRPSSTSRPWDPLTCAPTMSASSPHFSRIFSMLSEDRAVCWPRCSTGTSTLVRRSSMCWWVQSGSINRSRWMPSLAVSSTPGKRTGASSMPAAAPCSAAIPSAVL